MKYIQIWLDKTSDSSQPAWIVSEEDDTAETTTTLKIFDGESEQAKASARQWAEQEARRRGYTVEETTDDGMPAWHAPVRD